MEQWQKKLINDKLPGLVENTICNEYFLAMLEAKNVLAKCDTEAINARQEQMGRARLLYEMLTTRTNAFDELKEALSATNQTGALQILTDGLSENIIEIGSISYDKSRVLGEGPHGSKLYRGTFGYNVVAVKCISCDGNNFRKILGDIRQIIVLECHENMLRIFAHENSLYPARCIWTASEFCQLNLNKCLEDGVSLHKLTPESIILQITRGMAHLHENAICHGNLHPRNVLIQYRNNDTKTVVKVSDGGVPGYVRKRLAYTLSLVQFNDNTDTGWVSPEILRQIKEDGGSMNCSKIKLTKEADIFSLGCMFYYVLTDGDHPFGNHVQRNKNIIYGTIKFKASDLRGRNPYNQWNDLIMSMISARLDNRPDIHQVLGSPALRTDHIFHHYTKSVISGGAIVINRLVSFLLRPLFDIIIAPRLRGCNVPTGPAIGEQQACNNSLRLGEFTAVTANSMPPRCKTLRWDLNVEDISLLNRDVYIRYRYGNHHNILGHYKCSVQRNVFNADVDYFDVNLVEWLKYGCTEHIEILRQATDGVEFLHTKNILHLNLVPINLLRGRFADFRYCLKISNFQNAKMVGDFQQGSKLNASFRGTEGWIPPEMYSFLLSNESESSQLFVTGAADIFNLGMIFHYVLTNGKHPFGEFFERRSNIVGGTHCIDENNVGCDTINLISAMIEHDADKRPSISSVQSYLSSSMDKMCI